MATLYFNGAVDGEWTELDNWWTDENFTVAATALPTSADSVVVSGAISSNSGSAPTVVNLTTSASIGIDITVTGDATFDSGSSNEGAVTGNATFNGSSLNNNGGTVTGNATFNGSSYNDGDSNVGGNATFNDSTRNDGGIGGDATFNDDSYISDSYGVIGGNATFNDNSFINQYAAGNVYSNGGTFVIGGTATFSGNARNDGGIGGNAVLAYEKGINGSSILGVV